MKLVTEATTEELKAEIARREQQRGVRMLEIDGHSLRIDGEEAVFVCAPSFQKRYDPDRLALECSLAPCTADWARMWNMNLDRRNAGHFRDLGVWIIYQLDKAAPSASCIAAARAAGWIA